MALNSVYIQTESLEDAHCFVCSVTLRATRQWYDAILTETTCGRAYALPAVGAVLPGHVLVVPAAHTTSVHSLPVQHRQAFLDVLSEVILKTREKHGAVTIFEHSAPSATQPSPRAACTEHAHVQVVPGEYLLHDQLAGAIEYSSLESFILGSRPFDGYLMVAESGETVVRVSPDTGVSQCLRRKIFEQLGKPDSWDYTVFPRFDLVALTINEWSTSRP